MKILEKKTFVKENEEYFKILWEYFSLKMKISKLINYSVYMMCW